MADPLSLTASLIAVGTLAVQVSKFVKHALHTSDEVLALEDELEDLKALTKQLETLCQEQWPDEHQASVDEAKRILEDNIQTRLRKLQTLLAKHFRASKLKPTALSWVVLRRKINAEREGLNIGKQRLLNIFHLINTSTTRSLSFHPAQLSIDLERIRDSQDQNVKEIMNRLSQCPFPMDSNIHTILQALQQVQLGVNEINRKLSHSIDGPLKQPGPNAATEHAHGPELKHPALETPDPDSQRVYPLVNCILEGRETKYTLWCTCACHSPSKYLSLPNTLERLAGQLLIGFSVHPWLRPRCNLQSCKRSSETRVRLRYRFPAWWFFRYSVSLLAQPKDTGITLRFPQVRPCDADVFEMVAHGRLDALKSAFSWKSASIYDVEDTGGHTLLHRALITRNVDMIDFLLQQGADILAVNQKKNSSADIFWRNVLSNGLTEDAYGRLVSRFTDTTFIEDGGFTIIHKVIFGQSKADLDQMLTDFPHLVDQQDAYGLAPLHWAATRGDVRAIQTLLKHKANVHIVERGGSTPLIWGIDSGSTEVTKCLLDADSNPNHASLIWLDRAIHIACHAERFHCQIPMLLSAGADASASSRLRDSPLEFAASLDFAATVAASLDFAATVEALFAATDPSKHTLAVVAAVKNNALNSLRKLLEMGANCLVADSSGRTMLHYAAIHGLDPTVRLLGLYKRKLPCQSADDMGRFPADYAAERPGNELSRVVFGSLFDSEETAIATVEETYQQEFCGLNYNHEVDEVDEVDVDGGEDEGDEDEEDLEFEDAVQELISL
ncbi:ankyrin repeat-containing domain protein [Diaporthe sp. PMI_573]|nr:ankyrin repeat-containing domain protein [Diaporthaceae sp. PMI_573]